MLWQNDSRRDPAFQTENYAVVRKYFTLLTKTFNIDTAIAIRESCQMKKGKVYFVEIADPAQIETVLQGTKLSVDKCSGETFICRQWARYTAELL